jgi:hypothetical protein
MCLLDRDQKPEANGHRAHLRYKEISFLYRSMLALPEAHVRFQDHCGECKMAEMGRVSALIPEERHTANPSLLP